MKKHVLQSNSALVVDGFQKPITMAINTIEISESHLVKLFNQDKNRSYHTLPDSDKASLEPLRSSLMQRIMCSMNKESMQDSFDLDIAENLSGLVDNGKIDIEYYADACDDILRILNDLDDKDNIGVQFMDRLSKHTRLHIIEWVWLWREFFKTLSVHEKALQMHCDYYRLHWIGLETIENINALNEKYTKE